MQAKVTENRDGTLTIVLPINEPVNLSSTGKTYGAGNAGRLDVNTRFGQIRVSVNAFQFPEQRELFMKTRGQGKGKRTAPVAPSTDLE